MPENRVFQNTVYRSRRGVLNYSSSILIILIVSLAIGLIQPIFLKKIIAIRSVSTLFSFGFFLLLSIIVIGMVYAGFSYRILISVQVNSKNNSLSVAYIERFQSKVHSVTTSLLSTQIQVDSVKFSRLSSSFGGLTYITVYLTNEVFGTLAISDQEFKADGDLAEYFESLRYHIAGEIRKKH